ncbi:hypothetical protein NLG97_g11226 [Lecanicillium saksenae]|uniref:Uncharacterized protein n=1 Tax=Lecanicillium saksenae TaxID=468837 RepID=A0ACC1QE48_9HYPO|nr:hypothetical protein NLG97_g11226 [Lecanicillium saksenae]
MQAISAEEQRLYDVNESIKRALTEMLNCDIVRADASMRMWTQTRLMEAEKELRSGRRRRSSPCRDDKTGWSPSLDAAAKLLLWSSPVCGGALSFPKMATPKLLWLNFGCRFLLFDELASVHLKEQQAHPRTNATMSVLLETTVGDIVIDLLVEHAPKLCEK